MDKKIASVVGKVEGYISKKPKGKNGFGYDPIFIPKNKKKTFGEMKPFQKYKLDHRSDAFKKLRKFLLSPPHQFCKSLIYDLFCYF